MVDGCPLKLSDSYGAPCGLNGFPLAVAGAMTARLYAGWKRAISLGYGLGHFREMFRMLNIRCLHGGCGYIERLRPLDDGAVVAKRGGSNNIRRWQII